MTISHVIWFNQTILQIRKSQQMVVRRRFHRVTGLSILAFAIRCQANRIEMDLASLSRLEEGLR